MTSESSSDQIPSKMTDQSEVMDVSPLLFHGFWKYSRRLIRKKFCALRVVSGSVPDVASENPLLVYGNHASWWDPLVAVLINQSLFTPRQFRAPIDAAALERYSILGKLGFFPIEQTTSVGTRNFLRTMQQLFKTPSSVFITPHGRFLDVRDKHPFEPGLAHVVSRMTCGTVVPMAIEYTFWNESTPEILIQFGRPLDPSHDAGLGKTDWNQMLQDELLATQSSLAEKGIERDPQPFQTIIGGTVGEGGLYDLARRAKSALTGRRFEPGHEFSANSESEIET